MRALRLKLAVALVVFAGIALPARAEIKDDDVLLATIIGLIVNHDVAIIVGVLPTPVIQLTGETVELSANLALKALRPWLKAPADVAVDPATPPPGDSSYSVKDGCTVQFELLSPEAGYENMLGVANFRDAFVDPRDNKIYPWNQRWGFLGAPRLYHANSSVALSVRTPRDVRLYDAATGTFESPVSPIDPRAQAPQTVSLPIGRHVIEWRAGTQLNWISDVAAPSLLLAIGVLTEIKNARGGLFVAKKVKADGGIASSIVDEPLDPQGAARLSEGVKRFKSTWESAWKKRQLTKWKRELRKEVGCLIVGKMLDVLTTAEGAGINVLEEKTGNFLYQRGVLDKRQADLLTAIYFTAIELKDNLGIGALKVLVSCDDPHEFVVGTIATLLTSFDGIDSYVTRETSVSYADQLVTVFDSVPPVLEIGPEPLMIEAADFGGTFLRHARPQMLAVAEAGASDNCGRTPELTLEAPDFLPIGETVVTWTARDRGPNPNDGKDYAPTATQTVVVRDTQPPILLAPPSKVIESAVDVPLASAEIGEAAAVDLADVQPAVTNDAPASFRLDHRTDVHWTATDRSGNAAPAMQRITVKTPNTNTAPVASPASAQTVTAEPVYIKLEAHDDDELDGIADPLWFKIERPPAHGEFIAPLFPFFIEDYRTKPGDALGSDYDPTTGMPLRTYIEVTYCDPLPPLLPSEPPRGFVHNALFVHVTDEGVRYVLDEFFQCDAEHHAVTFARFSKWNAQGEFVDQIQIGASQGEDRPLDDTFVVDRDGFLYYYTASEPGSSSNELFLVRCDTDWQGPDTSTECVNSYKFDGSASNLIDAGSLSLARIDSSSNVAYVADANRLYAFELFDNGGAGYLGEVGPTEGGQVVANWLGHAQALEVGSDGSLYVADVLDHRIHKIGPAHEDASGALVPGDYVGWAGRCTSSVSNDCDSTLQRSRGYSCTFEADSCLVAADKFGSAQGQFDTPRFIAIDPRDVLYIADYENARVQRLSPDGSFAGEAVSDGSGINKGERPSFVVGNMGKPASVSVNSSQFFVVDRDEQFVHVFGTLPFDKITDNSVRVQYVSTQVFPSPNVTGVDDFTFSVTDGLARSAPAAVSVTVDRNYRAPVALSSTVPATEDEAVAVELEAHDPDGALDTLTYSIVTPPEHGELEGTDALWTYTPEAGFFGDDTFTFKANDGRDDSNEATVTVAVAPVNDAPEVAIEPPERVGMGFPIALTVSYRDDPAESHDARIAWGDGNVDATGGIVDPGNGEPALDGVLVTEAPMPGIDGQAVGQHTYDGLGTRTISACVKDDGGLETCDSLAIAVEHLVSLGVGGIVYVDGEPLADGEITREEVPDGVRYTYELTVLNALPSVGAGLVATNVVLDTEFPARLNVYDVTASQGDCTLTEGAFHCALGDLAPDAAVTIRVGAFGPGTVRENEWLELGSVVSTSAEAVAAETELAVGVDVVPNLDDTDGDGLSDGYELAFGLDMTRDDSGEDPDGDGLDNLTEFSLGTSPRNVDTDADGLGDQAEFLGGITSPTDPDTDADGMPDGWEVANGLDPATANGDADADGDGRSNLDEFTEGKNPRVDDVPPVVTPPADVLVAATGRLTAVPLGRAEGEDVHDGTLEPDASASGPFAPGANLVTWSATDAAGNVGVAVQHVDVVPLVDFAVDQTVTEGGVATVEVALNGDPVSYPVHVPYSVSGTATYGADHTAIAGEIVIASGLVGRIDVQTLADGVADSGETVVLAMGTPVNAVLGPAAVHTVTIAEGNLPPRVIVRATQGGRATTTVASDAGAFSASADVSDDTPGPLAFDWSASDAGIFDPAHAAESSFDVDPFGLAPGLYTLRVRVADTGTPPAATDVRDVVRVVDRFPILLATDDSDGDGIDDFTEGTGDADGDRVPDYLDAIAGDRYLAIDADGRALEVGVGLGLRLGETAFGLDRARATLAEDDLAPDPEHGYPNGIVDFEVLVPEPGMSARVVWPLRHPIAAGAIYRKFTSGAWQDFVTDADDRVASAPGVAGTCPPPRSAAYLPGLTAGDACVELTLRDGGTNDADGVADGVIRDPGGLAAPMAVKLTVLAPVPTLLGKGTAVVMHLRLESTSGDVLLRSLTLAASGSGDDRTIDRVALVQDVGADGSWVGDPVLATGTYTSNDGSLTLELQTPLAVPYGTTDVLVTYEFSGSP